MDIIVIGFKILVCYFLKYVIWVGYLIFMFKLYRFFLSNLFYCFKNIGYVFDYFSKVLCLLSGRIRFVRFCFFCVSLKIRIGIG